MVGLADQVGSLGPKVGDIGVGAQSTLGGHNIFARKICMKNNIMPEFYMILARKIIRIPQFL